MYAVFAFTLKKPGLAWKKIKRSVGATPLSLLRSKRSKIGCSFQFHTKTDCLIGGLTPSKKSTCMLVNHNQLPWACTLSRISANKKSIAKWLGMVI